MCVLLCSAFIVKLFRLSRLCSFSPGVHGQIAPYLTRNAKLVLVREDNLRLTAVTFSRCAKVKRMGICAQRLSTIPEECGTTYSPLPCIL